MHSYRYSSFSHHARATRAHEKSLKNSEEIMFDRVDEAAKLPAQKPRLGRRISWEELYRQRPDLQPANDNVELENPAPSTMFGV
jgi:hypothetical protein